MASETNSRNFTANRSTLTDFEIFLPSTQTRRDFASSLFPLPPPFHASVVSTLSLASTALTTSHQLSSSPPINKVSFSDRFQNKSQIRRLLLPSLSMSSRALSRPSPISSASMVNAPETKSTAVATQSKGDARNRAGIANYTQHWKESAQDTAEHTDARNASYKDVVNGYYDVSLVSLPSGKKHVLWFPFLLSSREFELTTKLVIDFRELPSCTSTVGELLSISVDTTKENLSTKLSPVTNIIWHSKLDSNLK